MGLKSLTMFNKNTSTLFFNNSFLSCFNYNRVIFFSVFALKMIGNYFNSFLSTVILSSIKKNKKIKQTFRLSSKFLFFGKINIFSYQKWFVVTISSFCQKGNNLKARTPKPIKNLIRINTNSLEL